MKKLIIYVNGAGGNAEEANHYKSLFPQEDVIGFDYHSENVQEAKIEFSDFFDSYSTKYDSISLIANSIGAYYCLSALNNKQIEKAFFISPIVDMNKLILDMMEKDHIKEEDLYNKKEIITTEGKTLSWDYLSYVRNNPIVWSKPTYILYGENDFLTSEETIKDFTKQFNALLTIMPQGEHWFHTKEQMDFLDNWIKISINK